MIYTCRKCGANYDVEKNGKYQCECGEVFWLESAVPATVSAPSTAICRFCKSSIPVEAIKCAHCGEFILEKRKIYKCLVLKFNDAEEFLNTLSFDGWEVVSHSTVFLSESSIGIWGASGSTREEGIAVILSKEEFITN